MTEPINILYVDDYPLDRELVRDALEKEDGGFQVVEAASRAELEARLAEGSYDLVLSDFNILGFEGLQVIDAVRAEKGPLPVVILTGTGSEEVAVEAMKRGAADYIIKKPEYIRRLPLTLRAVLDRVRAEEALKEQYSTLRGIIDSVDALVFSVDRQYHYTSFNQSHAAVMKTLYGAEIKMGRSVLDYITVAEDQEIARSNLERALAGEQLVEEAYSGEELRSRRYFRVSHNPIKNEAGQVIGVAVLAQDMTGHKQAEKALQESENRYRRITESLTDYQYSVRVENGRAVETTQSQACETVTGYTPEEFAADPYLWFHMIAPEDRELVRERIQQVLAGIEIPPIEHRIIRKDGTVRWVYNTTILLKDASGQLLSYEGVIKDITDRKQVEQTLLIQEQKYRTLVENIPNLIVRYNTNLRRTYVNPAWEKASGLSAIDVIDVPPADIPKVPQPIIDEYIDKLHRVLKTGTLQSSEFSWINARGVTLFLNYVMVPEYGQNGEIIGVLAVGHDITDRKRVEEEIHQLNQELEQRVLDRTAQLEAANKELEAFAYSISHDLRAPLRHIDGFLEMLQQSLTAPLNERSRHYMTNIADAVRRMGALIDDLLAFSRMGRDELSKRPIDLAGLVQEIIREFEPEIQSRTVHWRIADLPTVSGDRAMLRQVLVNLLSNALKFTRGCAQADIEIGCRADEKETTIFVRDNGVGFDMTYADKLFGVFQRLHPAEKFEGTGIGLANVHRIINRHGGKIWAEGQVNQGATFYFSLPQSIQEI